LYSVLEIRRWSFTGLVRITRITQIGRVWLAGSPTGQLIDGRLFAFIRFEDGSSASGITASEPHRRDNTEVVAETNAVGVL
jgi:hypothetical protein